MEAKSVRDISEFSAERPPEVVNAFLRSGRAILQLSREPAAGGRIGLEADRLGRDGQRAQTLLWAGEVAGREAVVDLAPAIGAGDAHSSLLLGLAPVAQAADGAVVRLNTAPGYELDVLLPRTDAETRRHIFHKKTRYHDVGTLRFVLQQVLLSPDNGVLDKIEAAKILSYGEMQTAEPSELPTCVRYIETALAESKKIPKAYGIGKDNRYHAVMSLWFIKAYLYFFMGDVAACKRTLNQIRDNVAGIDHCPTAANNTALGLTVLGYIHFCEGDPLKAIKAWNDVIAVFRRAAQHYPADRPKTFGELIVSFEAAKFCASSIHALKLNKPSLHPELNSDYVGQTFFRIRGTPGAARATEILEGMRRASGAARRP